MNRTLGVLGSLALMLAVGACGKSQPTAPKYNAAGIAPMAQERQALSVSGASAGSVVQAAGSVKGAAGEIPAYYDGNLITINSVELSDVAADRIAANNSHNVIYVTNDLDEKQDFNPVIDAIQGDGFNPLWEQLLIVFAPGVTPHQFFSDEEVLAAAAGARPEITLVDTHEVYRCSVVGKK